MTREYTYCANKDTCLPRLLCKRWIGNYVKEEAIKIVGTVRDEYIDDAYCIESGYSFLDKLPGIKEMT